MTVQELERRLSGRIPGLQGVEREYAVLVPAVERAGALHLLFEVRADTLSRQPGEVCFPGGAREPGETPEECVLRETEEELGILPASVRVLAKLDCICHQSGFLMHPILAAVDADAVERLVCGPAEVKETFLVPLSFFLENEPAQYDYDLIPRVKEDFPYAAVGVPADYRWGRGRVALPVYLWQGRAIWGLTGRIVHNLAEALR